MEINSAEILAIHRAVKISSSKKELKGAKIILESDSKNAVLWCNNDNGGAVESNLPIKLHKECSQGRP